MRSLGLRFCGASVLATTMLAMTGVGCQNKLYDENRKMREENRELRAQNEAVSAMKPAPAEIKPLEPAPLPRPPVRTPPPQPEVVMPPPAPAPTGGVLEGTGLDVSEDKAAGTTTVSLPGDIFFDSGKAGVKDTAKPSLDKVAAAIKRQYNGKQVRIQGHTDSDPIKHSNWGTNQALSKARADKVRDYLVSKGVASNLITTEGLGDTQPKDPAVKAKNRRVEVVVVTK